jgi:hypothetical protein
VYENRGFLHVIPERGCPEGQSGAVAGPDWGWGEVLCRGCGKNRDTFSDVIEENGVPVIVLPGCERNDIQSQPEFSDGVQPGIFCYLCSFENIFSGKVVGDNREINITAWPKRAGT